MAGYQMKTKILVSAVLVFLAMAFQNCERSPFIAYEGKIDSLVKSAEVDSTKIDKHLVSLNYYRGGWYGVPGQPNWAYDVSIDEKDGVYTVSAKATDSFCGKVSADLSEQQVMDLKKLLADLDIQKIPSEGPFLEDVGVHQITVKNLNEEAAIIQLSQMFGSPAGYYATNGDSLAAYIEALDSSLVMFCQ